MKLRVVYPIIMEHIKSGVGGDGVSWPVSLPPIVQLVSRQPGGGGGGKFPSPGTVRKYWWAVGGAARSLPHPKNSPGKYQQGKTEKTQQEKL